MTRLRQRMIEDMQLRGLSHNTQRAYIRVVSEVATYYNKPGAGKTCQATCCKVVDCRLSLLHWSVR